MASSSTPERTVIILRLPHVSSNPTRIFLGKVQLNLTLKDRIELNKTRNGREFADIISKLEQSISLLKFIS
jgi:hypothetical protein